MGDGFKQLLSLLQFPDFFLLILGKTGEDGEIMGPRDDRNRVDLDVMNAVRDLED